jgi:hypothetical protein
MADGAPVWPSPSSAGLGPFSAELAIWLSPSFPTGGFAYSHGLERLAQCGTVRDLASVRLNGKDLGTAWTAPWRLDIRGVAKAGDNELEIAVTNPWNNRLVGDDKLPADKRITSISLRTVKDTSPLLSAGLLGPVTIQSDR